MTDLKLVGRGAVPKTDKLLLKRSRDMRREQTPLEQKLWFALRGKRLQGVKFSRQVVIGPYIADFVARSRKLLIEVDGDTHDVDSPGDERRTAFLEREGYRVIRFTNRDVGDNLAGVLEAIGLALAEPPLTQPAPGEQRPTLFRPCWEHGRPGAPQRGEGF